MNDIAYQITMMRCYNKTCGIQYSAEENGPDSCVHHPGEPVFHDAYKGWSCCKKRTIDFTEFLNIPGCKKSFHNPDVPAEVPKSESKPRPEQEKERVVEAPRQPDPVPSDDRPSEDETMIDLPSNVGQSLKSALSKLDLNSCSTESEESPSVVKVGTPCKNNCCGKCYQGEISNTEKCAYHSGQAIFHEGMKYWSCCKIKTSDFDNFMSQPGCTTGSHKWFDTPEDVAKRVTCRYDWHQTSRFAVLSIYCKHAHPDKSSVRANRVRLAIDICFDRSQNKFQKDIVLERVIDPSRSSVQLMGSKVEVKLKKSEPLSWKKYEIKSSAS